MKYIAENRFVELDGDVDVLMAEIRTYFDEHIVKDIKRSEMSGETTYHIDYGDVDEMKHWLWLKEHVIKTMVQLGCKLNFNEFMHTLKFTFIQLEPGGSLPPHTASYIRAMSAFNIPLKGTTKIDLYADNFMKPREAGRHIVRHHYTNPCLLNVNQFHGVVNDADTTRLILKTHLMVVPFDKLVESFKNPVRIFDFKMPWSHNRGSLHRIEGESYS